MSAENTNAWLALLSLSRPRLAPTKCQMRLKSPSSLAAVNTRSATGLPRSRSSWASAH